MLQKKKKKKKILSIIYTEKKFVLTFTEIQKQYKYKKASKQTSFSNAHNLIEQFNF